MTRAQLPAFGYLYVALALPALSLGTDHTQAASALFTGAAFAYIWFLVSLRAKLIRFDPEGFYASIIVLGGAVFIALQTIALYSGTPEVQAPAAACAACVIIGSSLGAWRARKIARWFGQAGIAGGIAVLVVGIIEGAAAWTFAGTALYASALGFMVWVVVTATYLLRR